LKKYILAAVACLATMAIAAPAASAASIGGCQLQGTASFSPGLSSNSRPFSYSFGGNLTNCQSSQSGVPLSGTVGAGQILNEQVVNSAGATVTQAYQEPTPTGSGSCGSSTTSGQALTAWADGSRTVESYTTTGAAALVQLSGSVQPSMTLTAVNPPQPPNPTVPATFTISTTRYAGASVDGLLTFQPPDPTACNTATGVTSATISGTIGLQQ
jgi:hypothetical protein